MKQFLTVSILLGTILVFNSPSIVAQSDLISFRTESVYRETTPKVRQKVQIYSEDLPFVIRKNLVETLVSNEKLLEVYEVYIIEGQQLLYYEIRYLNKKGEQEKLRYRADGELWRD